MGGVNDQSFNELAWKGLQELEDETGTKVSYTESKQESDYGPNLDKAVDGENNLVWGIGFAMAKAIETAAEQNPTSTSPSSTTPTRTPLTTSPASSSAPRSLPSWSATSPL